MCADAVRAASPSPPPLLTARPRSPPIAFEPTPNDAMAIPQRQSIVSASPLPSKYSSLSADPMAKSSPLALVNGSSNGTRSASTPSLLSPPLDASDQTWRGYCALLRQSFDFERASWAVERGLLESEISRLQQEVLIAQTNLKQAELAQADPGSFHRSITSRSATRSPSRLSSPPSNNPLSGSPSKTSSPPRGPSAAAQVGSGLAPIHENNTPGRSSTPPAVMPVVGPVMFNSIDGTMAQSNRGETDSVDGMCILRRYPRAQGSVLLPTSTYCVYAIIHSYIRGCWFALDWTKLDGTLSAFLT